VREERKDKNNEITLLKGEMRMKMSRLERGRKLD